MHTLVDTCMRKVVPTGSDPCFIHRLYIPIITIHSYIQAYTNHLYTLIHLWLELSFCGEAFVIVQCIMIILHNL